MWLPLCSCCFRRPVSVLPIQYIIIIIIYLFAEINKTRHRASTSMYSLTFRVCVATPPNRTAQAAGASILSPARGVFAGMRSAHVRHACGVRWAWWITAGRCHAFPYCCHSNATRAPIANPPNSAQLGGIPYHFPKLHPGPCNSVGIRPWTDTQTDTQTRVTAIAYISRGLQLTRNVIM